MKTTYQELREIRKHFAEEFAEALKIFESYEEFKMIAPRPGHKDHAFQLILLKLLRSTKQGIA